MPRRDDDTEIGPDAGRRLFLHRQGLLDDPSRRATPGLLRQTIERMGFVQLDSINVVARAHHLILAARLDGYRPEHLRVLLERRRQLFEHWTHDASAIPTAYFLPWRHRCRRMAENVRTTTWLRKRMGPTWDRTLRDVYERVESDGPLMSKDFEHPSDREGNTAWWGWKPSKTALEYLWWRGDLTVRARVNFHKVYDLTARCFPDLHDREPPDADAYVDWACERALERLAVATPRELAAFFGAVSLAEARAWCDEAVKAGRVLSVRTGAVDGGRPRPAFALPDWRKRLAHAERALEAERARGRFRLLAPFDPVVRDRARTERLFGFEYRFEAFVPSAKRRYGYYVLPVLDGERFAARCDVKLHRERSELEVKGLWWEAGRGGTKKDRTRFDAAARRLADFVQAKRLRLPRG